MVFYVRSRCEKGQRSQQERKTKGEGELRELDGSWYVPAHEQSCIEEILAQVGAGPRAERQKKKKKCMILLNFEEKVKKKGLACKSKKVKGANDHYVEDQNG